MTTIFHRFTTGKQCMPAPVPGRPEASSWTENCTKIWVLLSAWLLAGETFLSTISQLNRTGNAILLALGVAGSVWGWRRLNGWRFRPAGFRWQRFRKPFPLLYLLCALAALTGGIIHAASNHDALSYRIPRILHWLAAGEWQWIGGTDTRMDFSGIGFEALMLPPFAVFHTLRFAFLINVITFLLLPGLIFSIFSALGVRRSIAATWMWILPCASCYVMEAGSIGNDLPACGYVLAALLFALRAIRSGKMADVVLAVLSGAVMTAMKAVVLPLLLPIAICLLFVFLKHPKMILVAVATAILASPISFVPIAIANAVHTGDWAGDANSRLKIEDPLVGVTGNAIIVGSASFAPAVFPQAVSANAWFNDKIVEGPLSWIKSGFADFRMSHPQLATEEHSGLGLGVSAALVLGLIGAWRDIRITRLASMGGLVFAGFWGALLFFMMKLGNSGAPRFLAPYYIGLIGLPLLAIRSGEVFRQKWWRWSSIALLLLILPALAMSPARPLLPMRTLIGMLQERGLATGTLSRMEIVYDVYANRSDAQKAVRALLPEHANSIGFAGTSAESEYSFWLPLGSRRVTDYTPLQDGKLPETVGFDAIVASNPGTHDRFGITPQQLAKRLNWEIRGTAHIRSLASGEITEWCVLVPRDKAESDIDSTGRNAR